jgi:hypothetical protein
MKIYNTTDGLGEAIRKSLETEIVQPLLTEAHIEALDRRLVKVLEVIYGCVGMNGRDVTNVVIKVMAIERLHCCTYHSIFLFSAWP